MIGSEPGAGPEDRPVRSSRVHHGARIVRLSRGVQISPGSRDQALGPIGQDQQQLQAAMTAHPAQHPQTLPFQRIPVPRHCYRHRALTLYPVLSLRRALPVHRATRPGV